MLGNARRPVEPWRTLGVALGCSRATELRACARPARGEQSCPSGIGMRERPVLARRALLRWSANERVDPCRVAGEKTRALTFGPSPSGRSCSPEVMTDLESMAHRRKEAHRKLLASGSKVYAAFVEMERAAFGDALLMKKYKELIAVGISVATNCESCMQWHIEWASGRSRRQSRGDLRGRRGRYRDGRWPGDGGREIRARGDGQRVLVLVGHPTTAASCGARRQTRSGNKICQGAAHVKR
jgi:AhpD family alkylhydroperoxidase